MEPRSNEVTYMFDTFDLFKSSRPRIFMSLCSCPYVFIFLYPYALILRLTYSVCLLVSLHPHILISLGSCALGVSWYFLILTSSYLQVHVLWELVNILASSHPPILKFMYSGCLLVTSYPHLFIFLGSYSLGAC